jgi:CheY-like chemotaxis protein
VSSPAITLQSSTPPDAIRKRVLFVDDEPLLTRLGAEFLRRLGYDAVTTTCPKDALQKFNEAEFDVVITDLTMPHMSGVELAEAMQRVRPNFPIVLTTAFFQKLHGKDPTELGFHSLLSKPYNIKALGDALEAALQSHA